MITVDEAPFAAFSHLMLVAEPLAVPGNVAPLPASEYPRHEYDPEDGEAGTEIVHRVTPDAPLDEPVIGKAMEASKVVGAEGLAVKVFWY